MAESSPPSAGVSENRAPRPREVVVLLHGWASIRWALGPLGSRLRREGFEVVSIGYPSVLVPLEELASRELPRRLNRIPDVATMRIHFVTHSMGGLVVRRFMELNPGFNVGRVVMMGPPNQGSAIADWLSKNAFYRWLGGPNLTELCTDSPSAFKASQGVLYPVGVVAGDAHLKTPWHFLSGPHDGKVTVASTRLAGMMDHAVVHCSHSFLPWHPRVAALAARFLRTGRFEAGKGEATVEGQIGSN